MKVILKSLFVVIIFTFFINVNALNLKIYSTNVLLYNVDDDIVLYEDGSDKQIPIASLTKIMTAIVALENIDNLKEKITIKHKDLENIYINNLSAAGFYEGQKVTYEDLIYGLLYPSGADAAYALSNNIAGSEEKMVKLMNEKAELLNLKNTHFSNVTGLDDKNNYSTLKEVSTIFKYALENKDFYKIISKGKYRTSDKKLTFVTTYIQNANKNNIDVNSIIGGKTGATSEAGLCFASIAKQDSPTLMLITTGAKYGNTPYNVIDSETIYNYYYDNYSYQTVVGEGTVLTTITTKTEPIKFVAEEDIQSFLPNNVDLSKIELRYEGVKNINKTTKKGTELGKVNIIYDNKVLKVEQIVLKENITYKNNDVFLNYIILLLLIISFLGLLILLIKHIKKPIQDKYILTKEENIDIVKKTLISIIHNSALIEKHNLTYKETLEIVNEEEMPNVSIQSIMYISNLKDAWKKVIFTMSKPVTLYYVSEINSILSGNPSSLRTKKTKFNKIPNQNKVIKDLLKILKLKNTTQRAIAFFTYNLKTELFNENNLDTSFIIANKIMIADCKGIITVKKENQKEFELIMKDFYKNRKTKKIEKFLYNKCIFGTNYYNN